MKRARFHRAAQDEIEASARWYRENRPPDTGDRFLAELDDVIARLESGRAVSSPVNDEPRARRLFFESFEHAVVFVEGPDEYFVLAVPHLRRHPGYWRSRLEDE
jgi:plasmid stabilization system protein ParE